MVSNILATCLVTFRNSLRIVVRPYKTMRSISAKPDMGQVYVLLTIATLYFLYASIVRTRSLDPLVVSSSFIRTFVFFLLTFASTIAFQGIVGKILQKLKMTDPEPIIVSCALTAYSLVPTIIWFFITSSLFLIFPPPRYETFLGTTFSIIFIIFSSSILLWRIILWYLTIRFSLKAQFLTIMIIMFMYGLWFVPYTFLMYHFRIFRIPFI